MWLRHEFPWIGRGFIHAIDDDYATKFQQDLARLGFEVVVLDGGAMLDEPAFWAEVADAFEFPDYFGKNWDAFHDCFGDLALPRRLAVVWRNADAVARQQLKLLTEAIAVLHETFRQLQECQGIVVLTGGGAGFARPPARG